MSGGHVTAEALERYRRRTAPAPELLAVDAHIAACDRCFAAVRSEDEGIELPSTHLSYEELEDYVNARAGELEAELVTAHAGNCAACRAELAELIAERDALDARARKTSARPSEHRRRLSILGE